MTDRKVKILPDDLYRKEIGQYAVPASCGTGSSLPYEFNDVDTKYEIDLLVVPTQLKPDPSDETKGLAIVVNVGGLPATVMVPLKDLSGLERCERVYNLYATEWCRTLISYGDRYRMG